MNAAQNAIPWAGPQRVKGLAEAAAVGLFVAAAGLLLAGLIAVITGG